MKTLYFLKRAFSLPPRVVIQKILYKTKKKCLFFKNQIRDSFCKTYSSYEPVSKLNRFIKEIKEELFPFEKIGEENQRFLKHEFRCLGSGWVHVPPPLRLKIHPVNKEESLLYQSLLSPSYSLIDWQLDFKSGFRFQEDVLSQKIKYGSTFGVDIKVPWELSRMHHLLSLAIGYGLEKKESYLFEFQNQILDFISSNPPRYGVNWVCTMDVGIRIANWLLAFDLFSYFGASLDPSFEKVFIRSVYEHGEHIFHHLEWDPHVRSNHYLANLAGLVFVSTYLPLDPKTQRWFDFAVKELIQEVFSQFHPEGSNFEASTSYHRLSAEMVLYATFLAREKGAIFPEEYLQRMQKMGEFIEEITKPDGTIVQFGDNDSGRFIRLFPEEHSLDHRYLACGIKKGKDLNSFLQGQLSVFQFEKKGCSAYPDFGLYIQRQDPWYLALRCGSIGQKGNGGHAHHDQLSFELSYEGHSMIVDPGTYVYTPFPQKRKLFRSSRMHNTLTVLGKEQHLDEGLFQMKDRAKAKVIAQEEGLFIAEHQGFGKIHRRKIEIKEAFIQGTDECEEKNAQIHFHFAPGWKGELLSSHQAKFVFGSSWIYMSSKQGTLEIKPYDYSKAYGENEKALVLLLNVEISPTIWLFHR